ncbi:MAG: DUF3006 domain-containing protein [Oscillospiraceae bacterium]|nr:DUF3006 domain-containing protein [Oscillospiraceae bacterium]
MNKAPRHTPDIGPGRLIIDRFEGDFAVCEGDGEPTHVNVPKSQIDCRAGEGAVIYYCKKHDRYHYDAQATVRRTAYIHDLTKDMWQ